MNFRGVCGLTQGSCRGAVGRLLVLLALAVSLCFPASAFAYTFHLEDARDWAKAHYDDQFYNDGHDNVCVCLASLAYERQGGVPEVVKMDPQDDAGFFVDPDGIGNHSVSDHSNSWTVGHVFRDHFQNHTPSGMGWERIDLWRCSNCPRECSEVVGGHVVFYHSADSATANANYDFYHTAVIYARHTTSTMPGWTIAYGTCKVDRYQGPNFINGEDHHTYDWRTKNFVAVNTLFNT